MWLPLLSRGRDATECHRCRQPQAPTQAPSSCPRAGGPRAPRGSCPQGPADAIPCTGGRSPCPGLPPAPLPNQAPWGRPRCAALAALTHLLLSPGSCAGFLWQGARGLCLCFAPGAPESTPSSRSCTEPGPLCPLGRDPPQRPCSRIRRRSLGPGVCLRSKVLAVCACSSHCAVLTWPQIPSLFTEPSLFCPWQQAARHLPGLLSATSVSPYFLPRSC